MDFIDILTKCEPSKSQIAKDAGVIRQSAYAWKDGRVPRKETFERLLKQDKYKSELSKIDFKALRAENPVGRPW